MALHYKIFLSEQAALLFASLGRREQVLLHRFIRRLGDSPQSPGDYRESDDEGRMVEVSVHERHAVLFWADHAVSKLMVVELREADRRS